MPLTLVQAPTFPGVHEASKVRENQLSTVAYNKPEWDEHLFHTAPKWWLQSFVESFCGGKKQIGSNTWNWAEKGKIFKKNIIASAADVTETAAGSGIFDITLADTEAWLVERDRIDLGFASPNGEGINVQAEVIATGTAGGFPTIQVKLVDTTLNGVIDGTATYWAADHEITLLFTAFGECFTVPKGRQMAPDSYTGALTKIVHTFEYCDDASNQVIWWKNRYGQHYFVPETEADVQELHRMSVDMSLLFAQRTETTDADGYKTYTTEGMIPAISKRGMIRKGAGAVVESDLQDLLMDLAVYAKGDIFYLICGQTMYRDVQRALSSYSQNGAILYASYKSGKLSAVRNVTQKNVAGTSVGINIAEYVFGDKTLRVMCYRGFADTDFLPQNGSPLGINYPNFGVALSDMEESCKLVYKKQRRGPGLMKDAVFYQDGPGMKTGGMFVGNQACTRMVYETHVGLELKGLQSKALLIND